MNRRHMQEARLASCAIAHFCSVHWWALQPLRQFAPLPTQAQSVPRRAHAHRFFVADQRSRSPGVCTPRPACATSWGKDKHEQEPDRHLRMTDDGSAGSVSLHAVDWASTQLEGDWGPDGSALRPGAEWSWHGEVWRLDTAPGPIRLEGALGRTALHRVAASRAARFARRPVPLGLNGHAPSRGMPWGGAQLLKDGFIVSDGRSTWEVGLAPGGLATGTLAVFAGGVPPKGARLWVVSVSLGLSAETSAAKEKVSVSNGAGQRGATLLAGTRIETPSGAAPVEMLKAGDLVLSDGGPRPVRRVCLHPAGNAVVLPAGLFGTSGPWAPLGLGPATAIGVEGDVLSVLFGAGEALVRARDLDALPLVLTRGRQPLISVELWAEPGHAGLVMAGGMPCLAAPVRAADLRLLGRGEAQIALAHRPAGIAPQMALRGAA